MDGSGIRRALLVLATVAAACEAMVPPGGGSNTGSMAPGGTAAGPANVAAAQGYCKGAVEAFCDTLAACGGFPSASVCTASALAAQLHAECRGLIDDRLVGLATGHLAVDAGLLQQCRARMKSACMATWLDGLCLGALRPTATLGQACVPSFGCNQGACAVPKELPEPGAPVGPSCNFGKCASLQVGDDCAQTFDCGATLTCTPQLKCAASIPAGGACSDKAYWCVAKHYCSKGSCVAVPPPPACPKSPGENCLWAGKQCEASPVPKPGEPAQSDLTCYHRFLLLGGKGAACGGSWAKVAADMKVERTCRFDLVCDAASKTCKESSAPGSACNDQTSCGVAALCLNGKCTALAGLGQACTGACVAGAVCHDQTKTCVLLKALGEACSADGECDLGECVNGKCAYGGCLAGG